MGDKRGRRHHRNGLTGLLARAGTVLVVGSLALSGCTTERIAEMKRELEVIGDAAAFDVEPLPPIADPDFEYFSYAADGALAMANHVGAAGHGADVYAIDMATGEVTRSHIVPEAEGLAEARFSISQDYVVAMLYTCAGSVQESDSVGYLCVNHTETHQSAWVMDRADGSWEPLPDEMSEIYVNGRVGNTIYFWDRNPKGTAGDRMVGFDLSTGRTTNLELQGSFTPEALAKALEIDTHQVVTPGETGPLVNQSLKLANAGASDALAGRSVTLSSGEATIELRYVDGYQMTNAGFFLTDEFGDRYLVTANS